jgi:hypothetical protein
MTEPSPLPAGEEKLLPCPNPWCVSHREAGYEPWVQGAGPSTYVVNCGGCSVRGPIKHNEAEAITAWNTRQGTGGDELARELEAIDARLRSVPTQDECSRANSDLLRFMDKAAPAIIAALRTPSTEARPDASSLADAAMALARYEYRELYGGELARLREALEPFAKVAEHDIGEDEADSDDYRPMTARWARAANIKVGDFRRARQALNEEAPDAQS